MIESDSEAFEQLATVFKAVGNPSRLAILVYLAQDRDVNEVVGVMDISRSGVQKHMDRLIDHNLVYRPPEADRTYALTPLGHFFVEFVEKHGDDLMATLEAVDEAEADARAELEDVPASGSDFEKLVTARMWDLIEERDTPL